MRHCPECFGRDNWHEPKCKLAREMLKRKSLTAVPVLAEPEAIALAKAGGVDGEARESTKTCDEMR